MNTKKNVRLCRCRPGPSGDADVFVYDTASEFTLASADLITDLRGAIGSGFKEVPDRV